MALLVGGSHATGAEVWADVDGHPLCLSDLDVYAVVPGRAAQRAALARARVDRRGLRARLMEWGLAAPLEAAFLVPGDLERLPARPATLELARHGLVLKGDLAWRERVPRWEPRDVSREEILLLHENRAFELLMAWSGLTARSRLTRLQARHAVLKSGLDVIRVAALAQGEYPEGAEALAQWAGRTGRLALPQAARAGFLSLLDEAVAWRRGRTDVLAHEQARQEWRLAVSAWVAIWQERVGPSYEHAVRAARRSRLRRRLRRAVSWPARSGLGPPLLSRLLHAGRGTPQHRVNASAAVLLLAAAEPGWSESDPRLSAPALRALSLLGVGRTAVPADWVLAARVVVEAWDRWLLDGQRTAEPG
jgi:hypothetical protein